MSAPAGGLSSLGGEGAGAGVKLNTGMASTLSCGADTGGQGEGGGGLRLHPTPPRVAQLGLHLQTRLR